MYQPMLYVHWKQIKVGLIPFILGAFSLPLFMVQGLGAPPGYSATPMEAYRIVSQFEVFLPFFPLLAAGVGMTLALSAWNWDHRYDHVWALSLPVARWEYVMLKMGAGAVLAMLPVAALWLGAHVAAASVELPTGLNAYPNQLAMRFGLAVLVSYSIMFAMAAGTIKTTAWIVSGIVGVTFLGLIANDFLALYFDYFERVNVIGEFYTWLVQTRGPLEVFSGNWALIDV